jgi:LAO/AO transport system kinase
LSLRDYCADLAARVVAGERRAAARAISLADSDAPEASLVEHSLRAYCGNAILVGVTGPPGAGKSTLVNALIGVWRRRGRRVAVLAVDPSSPISGGAVLGDRVRMAAGDTDEGVFIRSLAARGHLGGLSRSTARAASVLDAAGYDLIVIETVGAGQSEVEIAALAHTVVVVLPPGLGDEVQALKAGILEVANVLVVNKADLPGAERADNDLRSMLRLRAKDRRGVPVLRTVAATGEGIAGLADAIESHASVRGRARVPSAPAAAEQSSTAAKR